MSTIPEDPEDEFYTPRPSEEFRISLEKRASRQTEEMLSCRSSADQSNVPNVPMAQPGIPFSVELESGTNTSTDFQSTPPAIPEASFTIRNLITGEMIDLRDENESDFATRLAGVLTLRDDAHLEQQW